MKLEKWIKSLVDTGSAAVRFTKTFTVPEGS